MSLTLIEAIAGREKAEAVAGDLGLQHWDARHDSSAFALTRPFVLTVLQNALAFWRRDRLRIELASGVDEVSLALIADAWSRTYCSRALTVASDWNPRQTRNGVRVIRDRIAEIPHRTRWLQPIGNHRPAEALDDALRAIGSSYGSRTADMVATQLEYARR
jgi:hypothetical protein